MSWARPGPLPEKSLIRGRRSSWASTPKNRHYRPAYKPYRLGAGAWASYTTFGSRSPPAEHRGRGGSRAVPAWVTSLNLAPPSGPIRESRRPRSSRASGPAVRPERVRTRRPTTPLQPLPGVLSGEPSSLCGLPRSEARTWPLRCPLRAARCKPLIPGAGSRIQTPPHLPPPPGRRHPCHLLSRQTSLLREGYAKQEQPLGGARAPRPLARFSFVAPGRVWIHAPVERALP